MTLEEYLNLKRCMIDSEIYLDFTNLLTNQDERTLLFGLYTDIGSLHIYLKNKNIHVLRYVPSYGPREPDYYVARGYTLTELRAFLKYTVIYPERSDKEFCELLVKYKVKIPLSNSFLNVDYHQFYGSLYGETKTG